MRTKAMVPDTEIYIERLELEKKENWHQLAADMPSLWFPPNWNVTILPPFGGAVARMKITLADDTSEEKYCSIYFDVFDRLGYYEGPYWEIYPYDDDTMRYDRDDVDGLIAGIAHVLGDEEFHER